MRVPHTRYTVPDFYGDNNFHTVNYKPEDYPISLEDPFQLRVGDTEIAQIYTDFTALQSNWLWRYNFPSFNYSNFWGSSSTGSNGSTAIANLGVGVSNQTWYDINSESLVQDGYITSNSDGLVKTKLSQIHFSNYHDWVFYPYITPPSNRANTGMVIKFRNNYSANLPSDMYTISDHTITWNTSHPIYVLLYGEKIYTV